MALTPNQRKFLGIVADEPQTTAYLAQLPSAENDAKIGENAARNLMNRLEKRELVTGSGRGSARRWSSTALGVQALTDRSELPDDPAPPPSDSSPDSGTRVYVVLEELNLAKLVADVLEEAGVEHIHTEADDALGSLTVYCKIGEPEARNTEHALRVAAKSEYGDVGGEPRLVPIAAKMFQAQTVRIQNRQTVTVG